jgi:hypothetical protein
MTISTSQGTKEFVNKEFFRILKRYQVDVKDAFFNGERNMRLCFLLWDYLPVKS